MSDGSVSLAGQAGISNLYHYQDFQSEWLADILRHHRIYDSSEKIMGDFRLG
jgi:hypothetical protein